jgi:hypothetical protein
MAELDAGDGVLLLDEFDEAAERLDELVVPDAEIAERAAAAPLDLGGLDNDEPCPPAANLPAFIKCQSVGKPLIAEYWCIGGTTMRFFSVMPRIVIGENSSVADIDASSGVAGRHVAAAF